MSASKQVSVQFPAITLLGVAFVVLKLCHVINWSWWWVTAPFWGGIAVLLVLLVLAGILAAILKSR